MKRFSKIASLLLLTVTMVFTLASCQSPKQDVGDIVITVPGEETKEEAPVAEPVQEEPVVEEAPVAEEKDVIVVNLSAYGYEATIEIEDGKATFTYPLFITDEEIFDAAKLAYYAYKEYLNGTDLEIVEPGKAVLTFPTGYSKEDLEYAAGVLKAEILAYIDSIAAALSPAEEVVEVVETEEVPVIFEKHIELYGYELDVYAFGNLVEFHYPSFITNAEVRAAAEAAYAAYSQYLQDSSLVIDAGTAVLSLGYDLTEDDFNYATELLASELTYYVEALLHPATEEAEDVAVVAEEVPAVEEKAEEVPVVEEKTEEAPAVEEEKTEEVPVVEEKKEEAPAVEEKKEEAPKQEEKKEETSTPAATSTATAEPAKKSNAGVVVLIIVLVLVAAAAVYVYLKKKKN